MENPRVSLSDAAPRLYETVLTLDRMARQFVESAGIAEGFSHLLRLRASQLNQCAYCLRLHTREAVAAGESADRISLLNAWRETEYFNDKERAALALVEAVTLISKGQIPDSVYSQASEVLSDKEIAAIEWLCIVMNAWNRIAIASRHPVMP